MKKDEKHKLTKDDQKNWDHVTKTVTPLGKNPPPEEIISLKEMFTAIRNFKPTKPKRPQKVLDLHGMTRNEAYQYLETHLCLCKTKGYTWIEVITGRGHGKGDGLGILKRKVPLWFEGVKFKSLVKSWKQIPGNDGAIYVYLR